MADSNHSPGDLIRRRRVTLGLSRAELGEKVGRTGSTVRRWERGEGFPPEPLIPDLAKALEVDVSELRGDSKPGEGREPEARAKAPEPPAPTEVPSERPTRPAAPPREFSPIAPEPAPARSEHVAPASAAAERPAPGPPVATPPRSEEPADGERRMDVSELPTEVMALPSEQETRPVASPRAEPLRPVRPAAPVVPAPSYVEDPRQRYRYWLRYLLTGIAIAVMLIVLAWAFTELREALGDVWDLFQEEEIDNGDIGTDF